MWHSRGLNVCLLPCREGKGQGTRSFLGREGLPTAVHRVDALQWQHHQPHLYKLLRAHFRVDPDGQGPAGLFGIALVVPDQEGAVLFPSCLLPCTYQAKAPTHPR